MKIPAFGEVNYIDNQINENSHGVVVKNVSPERFEEYVELFVSDGYTLCERNDFAGNRFAALKKESEGAFINYYSAIRELTVVTESVSEYFSFSDVAGENTVQMQITQLSLEDYGMSYAVRLSDGRFILIDGGQDFEPDARKLYELLKRSSGNKKPTVAAWILTHPHNDHLGCFLTFMELFASEVNIEKVMLNFPALDDTEHFPDLMNKDYRRKNPKSTKEYMLRAYELIKEHGLAAYMPHTGQTYVIGDAVCRVIASLDDTIYRTFNINSTSLVIRMEIAGQSIFWGADAAFYTIDLVERYGDSIRSDILQIPHHGFQCGYAGPEIAGYRAIAPKVCLLPASEGAAFISFSTHKKGTEFLMRDAGVEEIITGGPERTLTLPYFAKPEAKSELERRFTEGRATSGSKVWVFTELSTALEEDLTFSFVNFTVSNVKVIVDIKFENGSPAPAGASVIIPPGAFKKIRLDGEEVKESESFYDLWEMLNKSKFPKDTGFVVRFRADTPIVISNKNHSPTYVSPYVC
ncbi:MAG: MBL fold metallo-hydrolase [Clostridia bacterium]|nr:MBL fold metallo-hydrolase [Clostridia bacterium]MBQ8743538.1 MBL fold metallo-hydrolase [Clostridia bacterium]